MALKQASAFRISAPNLITRMNHDAKAYAHSRGPERDHLTGSGRDVHEVFDTPIGKVGLLICWDLAFPEAFRELIANGAKIMYVSNM